MATTIQVTIQDQEKNGIANVEIQIWSNDQDTVEKLHSNLLLTDSNGQVTMSSTNDDLEDDYPNIYCKLYSQGTIIKTITGIDTAEVVVGGLEIDLQTTPSTADTITGTVTDELTTEPLEGIGVEIWPTDDSSSYNSTMLTTDEYGEFTFDVDDLFFLERHPEIFFKIYYESELVKTTNNYQSSAVFDTAPSIAVAVESQQTQDRVVFGKIVDEDGSPLSGYTVKAYSVVAGTETLLDTDTTTSDGNYSIDYSLTLIANSDNSLHLKVKVYDTTPELVLTSPLILNSLKSEQINLANTDTAYKGVNEYKVIDDILKEETGSLTLSNLSDQDISILAEKTELDAAKVASWTVAQELKEETSIHAEILYALINQGFVAKLSSLLLQKKSVITSAIEAAIENNIIDSSWSTEVESAVTSIYDAAETYATSAPTTNYRVLIGLTSLTATEGTDFLTSYLNNEGDEADFWTGLTLSAAKISELKEVLNLSAITLSNVGFVSQIKTDFTNINTITEKDSSYWDTYISTNSLDIPDEISGDTEAERRAAYAGVITDNIEYVMATASIVRKVETDSGITIDYLDSFYTLNPDFDFRTENVEENKTSYSYPTFSGITQDEFVESLKAVHRLFLLTPDKGRFAPFKLLWNDSLHSAMAIVSKGKAVILRSFSEASLDEETALFIYNRAEAINYKSMMTYAYYAKDLQDVPTDVLFDRESEISNPTLEEIFGSMDYCKCNHCQSVYGPSAYFADLLYFLKEQKYNGSNLYDALHNKRKDIDDILLECKNATTPVPYIDIINEILENAITDDDGTSGQTNNEQEDILAYPEHINHDAYETLESASYPWILPFRLYENEARAYLGHLGINRSDLLASEVKEPGTKFTPLEIACSYFNISFTNERTLITNSSPTEVELRSYYGYTGTIDLDQTVKEIPVLLEQTGIEFEFLLELIQSEFINPNGKSIIYDSDESCALAKATLLFNDSELSKLHRFCRLQKKIGWSVEELDKAITTFGGDIDSDLISHCYFIEKIMEKIKVSVLEALAWWGNMGTSTNFAETPSLYEKVFLAKSDELSLSTNPFELANLNNNLLNLGTNQECISHISSAVKISENEIEMILSPDGFDFVLEPPQNENITDPVSLSELSKIYRTASFCNKTSLSVKEYYILNDLMQDNPFGTSSLNPEHTYGYLSTLDKVKDSGFSIFDLQYFLTYLRPQESSLLISDSEIGSSLEEIRTELKKIRDKYILDGADGEGALAQSLSIILEDRVDAICDMVGDETNFAANYYDTLIGENVEVFLDEQDAIDHLSNTAHADFLSSKSDRMLYISKSCGSSEYWESESVLKQKITQILVDYAIAQIKGGIETNSQYSTAEYITSHDELFTNTTSATEYFQDFHAPTDDTYSLGNPDMTEEAINHTIIDLEAEIQLSALKKNLKSLLSHIVDEELIEDALELITNAQSSHFLDDESKQQFISNNLSGYINSELETSILSQSTPEAEKVSKTIDQIIRELMKDFVCQKLAAIFEMDISSIKTLLYDYLKNEYLELKTINSLTSLSFVKSTKAISRDSFKLQYMDFEAMYKVITFMKLNDLSINDVEIIYSLIHKATDPVSWLEVTELTAYYPQISGNVTFERWLKLNDAIQLNYQYFLPINSVFGLLNTDSQVWYKLLSEITGWSEDSINAAVTEFIHSDELNDETWLVHLESCLSFVNTLGIRPEQFKNINSESLDQEQSSIIRKAVKAKMGDAQWLEVAPKLRKPIRESQRDALCAYLIGSSDFENIKSMEDIFDEYLIDPEMSSCAMTSRIKQATLSIQLYIQRLFLNQEEGLKITKDVKEEWIWRKNYRVWEANRKILIQPENYLEPDLRKDKTPLFAELEKFLNENDINGDTVEQAYRTYLNGLNEVSNLEMCGLSGNHINLKYSQLPKDYILHESSNDLHILGRTQSSPHQYYYQKRVDRSYWTPWQKITCEITGENVAITEWNDQVYVFWLEFVDKSITDKDQYNTKGDKSKTFYEIFLAWTVYKNGKWSSKLVSDEPFITTEKDYGPDNGPLYEENIPEELLTSAIWADIMDKSKYTIMPIKQNHSGDNNLNVRIYKITWGTDKGYYLGGFCFNNPYQKPEIVNVMHDCSYNVDVSLLHPWNKRLLKSQIFEWPNSDSKYYIPFGYDSINLKYSNVYISKTSDTKIIYPSNRIYRRYFEEYIGREFISTPYLSYYSQDPVLHQDEERVFLIEPKWSNQTTVDILDDIIKKDIYVVSIINLLKQSIIGDLAEHFLPEFFNTSYENVVLDRSSDSIVHSLGKESETLSYPDPRPPYTIGKPMYRFKTLHHPFVHSLIKEIDKPGSRGIEEILAPAGSSSFLRQEISNTGLFSTNVESTSPYIATHLVIPAYPNEEISFTVDNPYMLYNWELFYYIPMLIADRLSKNKRFEEAQQWYHYIFDPTSDLNESVPQKFWKLKPFVDIQDIPEFQGSVNYNFSSILSVQIALWRKEPFNPHILAMSRPIAYMKHTVMKYLDNLIAWGDMLFARDSMESINEATQIYILAAKLLGRKPIETRQYDIEPEDFNSFYNTGAGVDDFSNKVVDIEYLVWTEGAYGTDSITPLPGQGNTSAWGANVIHTFKALYFCIPKNDKLLAYWDTVADRLFKIRHCMNISGIVRQLPLFEPPIDPALIARALAGGVSLSAALNELNAPLPFYRYQSMHQKALELSNEVKALGQAYLSALEKKDAESLSLLRSSHELKMQSAIFQLKKASIEEADAQINSLKFNQRVIEKKMSYYNLLIETGLISEEDSQLAHMEEGHSNQLTSSNLAIGAQASALIPNFNVGLTGGSPWVEANMTFGGQNFTSLLSAMSTHYSGKAASFSHKSAKAGVMAGHERRKQEWNFQVESAQNEIEQIDKQLLAAEIRKEMAEQELKNTELQMDHSEEMLAYLEDKFTNEELYGWMAGQLSDIYFQSYQIAVDLAKKAERTYRYETGDEKAVFIQNTYWDTLKKGLLSGERLVHDLRRMEIAYMDRDARKLEMTKHVSLASLNPDELVNLRKDGYCSFSIPEVLFDLDFPGQYNRRIKSVSISIPAVTGPYTNVNCKFTLSSSRYRKVADAGDGYVITGDNDPRFVFSNKMESRAASSGQNDHGVFEFNFNDSKYLPFEGAGAISDWLLELPETYRQFDYDTISDVILHINYTALEDGGLKEKVATDIEDSINYMLDEIEKLDEGMQRLFSMKAEFPEELHEFLNPASGTANSVDITLENKHFPHFLKGKTLTFIEGGCSALSRPNAASITVDEPSLTSPLAPLSLTASNLTEDSVDDIWILVSFTVSNPT